jgi:hypothetical protein
MQDETPKTSERIEPAVIGDQSEHAVTRLVVATVLWSVIFAVATAAGGAFRLGLPGHSVVFWLPALFMARKFCGYRGSSLIVCSGGGLMAMTPHPAFDGRIVGWILGAVVVEAVMILVDEGPGFFIGFLMGMAANLGKMAPKVVTIIAMGHTPRHNKQTLPFMLVSYLLFGAIAGLISVSAWKGTRKLRK